MISRSLLQSLSEDCSNLLFYSECIEGCNTTEMIENNRIIKQALRKIIIANEISNRMIICVTGLQGTGKTTLMKNYYNIDEAFMNVAFGRGERLPIFISEDDVSEVKMYSVGIEKNSNGYSQCKKAIEANDFVEFSKGENEDSTIMYLELVVPRRYLSKGSNVSFMLLPGYEKGSTYWDTLIDFSVQSSDTAIFVMTPEKVADMSNAQMLEKINGTFGDNIIYVLTHSDESSDDNAEVKSTLMGVLGCDNMQGGRFICAGAYADDTLNEKWKKQLQTAIEVYSSDFKGMEQRSSAYLEKIIAKDLRPAVISIKKYVTDVTDDVITGFEYSPWLNTFDNSKAKVRKRFQESLHEKFMKSQDEDKKQLLENMKIENKGSYLRRAIFKGSSLKDVEKARQTIDEAMHDKLNGNQYRYEKAFVESVMETIDVLCAKDSSETIQRIGQISTSDSVLNEEDEERKVLIIQDVSTILSPNRTNSLLKYKDPRKTMQVIVECGAKFFGLMMLNDLYSEQYITVPELAESHLSKEKIQRSIQNSEVFAMEVLGITGLDLMGDGVLNFIPSLAEALGVATPVAGAIVALFVGGGVAKSIVEDFNKMQLEDYWSYGKAISAVYNVIEKKYMDKFDEYMSAIRERIENYLIECLGVNNSVISKQNVLISIKNIQASMDSIRKELGDNTYDPTNIIRE